jgi:hypothetical protein
MPDPYITMHGPLNIKELEPHYKPTANKYMQCYGVEL